MSSYIGEIRMFAGSKAPSGWALCEGQLLSIDAYRPLFDLIGTKYGGNGETTFALPDLRGRVPVHQGNGLIMGELGGSEAVSLAIDQIPTHSHVLRASQNLQREPVPTGKVLGQTTGDTLPYVQGEADTNLSSQAVATAGSGRPHNNMAPYLCINFIIALFGTRPSS